MFFKKRHCNRFDGLDPLKGPGIESDIRNPKKNCALTPFLWVGQSREGYNLSLQSLKIHQTYVDQTKSSPWAMTIRLLQETDTQDAHLLPFYYIRQPVEISSACELYVSLPPYKLTLELVSEDYVPEEDESCFGSCARCILFSEEIENWKEKLTEEIHLKLEWKAISKPLWRK